MRSNLEFLLELASEETDNCIIWPRGKTWDGYPKIKTGGYTWNTQYLRGHRIVLEKKLGRQLGFNKLACHTCDTPACINPKHLFEGTYKINAQDMARKKRGGNRYKKGI